MQQTPLVKTESGETNAEVSTDGRWLAYDSDDSREWQVYAEPSPIRTQGRASRWQSDGHRSGPVMAASSSTSHRGNLMSVPIRSGKTWSEVAGAPVKVIDAKRSYLGSASTSETQRPFRMYDYDHGKRRFLMLKPAGESAPSATTSRACRRRELVRGVEAVGPSQVTSWSFDGRSAALC